MQLAPLLSPLFKYFTRLACAPVLLALVFTMLPGQPARAEAQTPVTGRISLNDETGETPTETPTPLPTDTLPPTPRLTATHALASTPTFTQNPSYTPTPSRSPTRIPARISARSLAPLKTTASLPVYADALASGWEDWSYGGVTKTYANPSPVHAGSASVAVTYTDGWSGLQIGYHGADLDVSSYDVFRFWVHGGSAGGQTVVLQIGDLSQTITPQANTWRRADVSLLPLGSPRSVSSIAWFNNTAGSQPVFFLDDIAFVNTGAPTPTSPPPTTGPALSVNGTAGQHPISPYIYGINYASETIAADLRLPVRRWGGNATTLYNWQYDISNRGSDWYFENVLEDSPAGSAADHFVDQDRRTGTRTLLTLPLIGWTPKNSSTACSFSIMKYSAQADADWQWRPDCGNGVRTNGTDLTGNDPHDANTEITPAFVTAWVKHLTAAYGTAAKGGVLFYDLDNEPMLWNSTHRDVHPSPTTYDEMRDRTWAYAAAVKAADPTAKTLGPVVWGWCAYFYSAADGCSPGPDRQAHSNVDFVEWYLQQMRAYQKAHGVRILDYVDVHIYPQIDGVYADSPGSADVQAKRLRSTRQLWDPTYVHEGWIGQPVYLIPRMRQWVASDYPGTRLAISEYNWGALGYMNGALAQADLLGIFGRERLDLATLWGPPDDPQAPGIFAFRMYRNYDGKGSAFGETSLHAASANQDKLAVYAAMRSRDGALTLMVINKTARALTSKLALTNFKPGASAQVYRYSAANLAAIVRAANQPMAVGGFTATFQANSITLIVVPAGSNPPGAFAKSSPANGAADQPTSLSLKWAVASNATRYEYCLDTTNNNACDSDTWVSTGMATTKTLTGLTQGLRYYWQVRTKNNTGYTYANGASTAWWSFTVR